MNSATIAEHAIIGNMRSAALVNVYGEIDFFCFPEFDSPTVFASVLDTERAGCFCIRPAGEPSKGSQLYVPNTNVLLTRFLSQETVLEVCDFMPVGSDKLPHCIVRKVTAIQGEVDVVVCCRPAFDYARKGIRLDSCDGGIEFTSESTNSPRLRLFSSIELQKDDSAAVASFHLQEGESACFLFASANCKLSQDLTSFVTAEFDRTCGFWRAWAAKSLYKGRWREMVTRSALTLKLLTNSKNGSILAAPTFGLPEVIGGQRNWDYRFVWMRDAAFTTYAFIRLGFVEESQLFQHWLESRLNLNGDRGPLEVMYRPDGGTDIEETALDNFSGFQSSRPVRIGNGAAKQLQLDIYGELIDSVYLSSKYGDGIPYQGWLKMKAVLRWLADHWQDPDEGIWEVRGGRREFLHSRLMCWVAFDRAVRLGRKRSLAGPFQWMEDCRDAIVADIHEHFWNEELGAFVQYKGSTHVDASALLLPLMRFVSPNDPRWLSTLRVIERELVRDTSVRRYSSDNPVDGLKGSEGGFTACAFWLVEAKARSGREDEAVLLLEKLLSQANPVGLFAEEMDIAGQHLGNFPQALSHLALISAVTYLDRCLDKQKVETWV